MAEIIERYQPRDPMKLQDIGRFASGYGEEMEWFHAGNGIGLRSRHSFEADRFVRGLGYTQGSLVLRPGDKPLMENGNVSKTTIGYDSRDSRHIGNLIKLIEDNDEIHVFAAEALKDSRRNIVSAFFSTKMPNAHLYEPMEGMPVEVVSKF